MKYLLILLMLFIINCTPTVKPVDELEKTFLSNVEYACFIALRNNDRLELFPGCVVYHMNFLKDFKALKVVQDKTNVSK